MDLTGWSLNLAKDRYTGQTYLALAHLDTSDVRLLATFDSEDAVDIYTRYMEQNGWAAMPLPTQSDIDALLDE